MRTATHVGWADIQHLYTARRQPRAVEVPTLHVLAIDGSGMPGGAPFADAFAALMRVSYTAKFQLRRSIGLEWKVPPPEGQFWTLDDAPFETATDEQWRWRLFVVQPAELDEVALAPALAAARARDGASTWLDRIRLLDIEEGPSVQVLHVGPYEEEQPTIERLHAWLRAEGYEPTGVHHEIYLGDPRRSDPATLETIIRQPVKLRARAG